MVRVALFVGLLLTLFSVDARAAGCGILQGEDGAPVLWSPDIRYRAIEWCVEGETTESIANVETKIYLDTRRPLPMPPVTLGISTIVCRPNTPTPETPNPGLTCNASLPPEVISRLNQPGPHTVEMTLSRGGGTESAPSAAVQVQTADEQCTWTDPVSNAESVHNFNKTIMGRSNKNSTTFGAWVNLVESQGWVVEVGRAQWDADRGSGTSFVSGGFWWYRAKCKGFVYPLP